MGLLCAEKLRKFLIPACKSWELGEFLPLNVFSFRTKPLVRARQSLDKTVYLSLHSLFSVIRLDLCVSLILWNQKIKINTDRATRNLYFTHKCGGATAEPVAKIFVIFREVGRWLINRVTCYVDLLNCLEDTRGLQSCGTMTDPLPWGLAQPHCHVISL